MLANSSAESDSRRSVWKYALAGVIALFTIAALFYATSMGNTQVSRQSHLQGIIADFAPKPKAVADSKPSFFVISAGTFSDVKARCSAEGGSLASIESADQNAQVQAACGGNRVCYIGLTDEYYEGYFNWVDGSRNVFSNWARGEPNNVGNEDCVEMYSASGQWNDIPCSHSIPAVCKTYKPVSAKSYFLTAQSGTFEGVKADCVSRGGTLASITSSADVANAQQVCDGKRTCYIGLNDQAIEGQWRWVNGAAYGFTNWNWGEPNNVGNEDCVEMYSSNGKWNDIRCTSYLYGICQK